MHSHTHPNFFVAITYLLSTTPLTPPAKINANKSRRYKGRWGMRKTFEKITRHVFLEMKPLHWCTKTSQVRWTEADFRIWKQRKHCLCEVIWLLGEWWYEMICGFIDLFGVSLDCFQIKKDILYHNVCSVLAETFNDGMFSYYWLCLWQWVLSRAKCVYPAGSELIDHNIMWQKRHETCRERRNNRSTLNINLKYH